MLKNYFKFYFIYFLVFREIYMYFFLNLCSVWGHGHLQHDVKHQPRDVERPHTRENPRRSQEPPPSHEGNDA